MAKLGAMPSKDIISGFKGVIDFYVCRGQPCARRWPRYHRRTASPARAAQWPIFADAVAEWNNLAPIVRDAYNTMASGATLSGRDMMIKMYINAQTILPY